MKWTVYQTYSYPDNRIFIFQAKIVRLRDQAYELDKENVKELNMEFELHLCLTMECIEANQSPVGFRRHLLSLMAAAEPKQSYAAKLLVEAGDSRADKL